MAQKREKEETLELKVSTTETLTTLCPDNCKIPPPSTAQTRSVAGSASPDPIRIDSVSHAPPARAPKRPRDEAEKPRIPEAKARVDDAAAVASVMKKTVNRCSGCRKRVGLTGFRCRCGEMFCSVHRYSDRHDCGFDYKAAGREAIERDNPVVRAAKILKI